MCCNYKINNELLQEKGAKEKAKRKTEKKSATATVDKSKVAEVEQPSSSPSNEPMKDNKQRKIQTDWTLDKNKLQMQELIDKYNDLTSNGKLSIHSFCKSVNISRTTFKRYLDNPHLLGECKLGKPTLLNKTQMDFIGNTVKIRDRAQNGCSVQELNNIIIDLSGGSLNNTQANDFRRRTLKNKQGLSKVVAAQDTTTHRAQADEKGQARWHMLLDSVFNQLKVQTGNDWDSIAKYFVFNLDETNFIASDGRLRIIGEKNKKHEKTTGDSRASITVVRCGNAAGQDGPMIFLLAGKRKPCGFTDNFLEKCGAPQGSTIIMTEVSETIIYLRCQILSSFRR